MFPELKAFSIDLTQPINKPSPDKLVEVVKRWGPLYVSGLEDPAKDLNETYGKAHAIIFGLKMLGQRHLVEGFQNNRLRIPEDVTLDSIYPFEIKEEAVRQILANYEGAALVGHRRWSTNAVELQKELSERAERMLHEGAAGGFKMILQMLNQESPVSQIDQFHLRYFRSQVATELRTRNGLVNKHWPLPKDLIGI